MNYRPDGYSTATPYLIVNHAGRALAFYEKALGASVIHIDKQDANGEILHVEFRIGDSNFMMGSKPTEVPSEWQMPQVSLYLYVEKCDAMLQRAVEGGGRQIAPMSDKPYGNREGGFVDPFGITWWLATRIEDVSGEEMQRRMSATA